MVSFDLLNFEKIVKRTRLKKMSESLKRFVFAQSSFH